MSTQDLSLWHVALSSVFVLVLLVFARIRKIGREKQILVSSARMTLQLVAAGWVLVYILKHPHPLITALILVVMEVFAIRTIFAKFAGRLSRALKRVIIVAMTLGTLACLMFFVWVVVAPTPWYSPQYFVPLAGMIIGNSMTGITLGVKALVDGMSDQRLRVEEVLILGGTPAQASREILDRAFDTAIMPTINNMVGMGIVFLPGMMTGQILSGVSPMTAIAYQIAIMFAILGAVSTSVVIFLQWGYRTYFNDDAQLVV